MSEILSAAVFRQVMDDLHVGVYFTDLERRIVFWNSGAERITGYLSQEVVGRLCRENILMHCDHQRQLVCSSCCPLAEAISDGKPREASLFLRHKSGHRVPVRIHTMAIRNAAGAVIGAAESFLRQRDVPHPERRDLGSGCASYALLGVADVAFVISELRLRLARWAEGGNSFGLLCTKLDRFEEMRVSRGQEACETALHVIASTFQNTIRPGDCMGTWPEGRLMLVVSATTGEQLERMGERLRGLASCSNVVWWGDAVPVTISCGAAIANRDDTLESLVRRAERALQESLTSGGDRVTMGRE